MRSIPVALAAAVVPFVLLLGCGSGDGPSARTSSVSTAPVSSAAPTLSAADRTQIAAAFATFFSGSTTAARAQQFLQHGSAFAHVLSQQAGSAQAKSLRAQVTAITARRAHVAATTFTLSSGGNPLLPGAHGYAVQEGGRWKVSAATFCQLLTLQAAAPAQCSDASITALPAD